VRSLKTQKINSELTIVKLGHQRFSRRGNYMIPSGYAFYHPTLGYFSFDGECPYIPVGGRKALEAILAAGGLPCTSKILFG
jgi:hypothetical protein